MGRHVVKMAWLLLSRKVVIIYSQELESTRRRISENLAESSQKNANTLNNRKRKEPLERRRRSEVLP